MPCIGSFRKSLTFYWSLCLCTSKNLRSNVAIYSLYDSCLQCTLVKLSAAF